MEAFVQVFVSVRVMIPVKLGHLVRATSAAFCAKNQTWSMNIYAEIEIRKKSI